MKLQAIQFIRRRSIVYLLALIATVVVLFKADRRIGKNTALLSEVRYLNAAMEAYKENEIVFRSSLTTEKHIGHRRGYLLVTNIPTSHSGKVTCLLWTNSVAAPDVIYMSIHGDYALYDAEQNRHSPVVAPDLHNVPFSWYLAKHLK
ncbi:MAG: hypothetical protein ACPGVU_05145 [Limisphaerales bacterium]